MPDNSVDLLLPDPPYGLEYMGKDWDKALPSIEIWREGLRVLKPGALAFIMSSSRQDLQARMVINLQDAGFEVNFSPFFWAYHTGFASAHNIQEKLKKRPGVDPEKAKNFEGAYVGFNLKPAVEIIIVARKPLEEKTLTDQALSNGKGITWLDDCMIPLDSTTRRLPSNLLVSDNVLDDVRNHAVGVLRNYSLDAWAEKNLKDLPDEVQQTFPFIIVPKASMNEKDAGLEDVEEKVIEGRDPGQDVKNVPFKARTTPRKNIHPTVKPIKLMSYLITLGSREGDVVLDPFAGSGTTCMAAKMLNRKYIGIEKDPEYHAIAEKRVERVDIKKAA